MEGPGLFLGPFLLRFFGGVGGLVCWSCLRSSLCGARHRPLAGARGTRVPAAESVARRESPSMAQRGSPGIHAGGPPIQLPERGLLEARRTGWSASRTKRKFAATLRQKRHKPGRGAGALDIRWVDLWLAGAARVHGAGLGIERITSSAEHLHLCAHGVVGRSPIQSERFGPIGISPADTSGSQRVPQKSGPLPAARS